MAFSCLRARLRASYALGSLLAVAGCGPVRPGTDAQPVEDVSALEDASVPMDVAPRDAAPRILDANLPEVAQTPLPDFSLTDQNAGSPTAGMPVSLSGQRGAISAWYFATSACRFCIEMVSQLDRMQRELSAANPRRPVRIFVVADLDSDGATSAFTAGHILPVLQDNRDANVQSNWMASIRDIVVVDDEGTRRFVYNVNTRPLSDAFYFGDLEGRLLSLAER
jgi:hypothetical protein